MAIRNKKDDICIEDLIKHWEGNKLCYCSVQLSKKCKSQHGISDSSNFYSAYDNPFYQNNKFCICKNCVKEYVYKKDKNIDVDKFKNILRIFDLPFLEKEFKSATEDSKETVGVYIKNIFLNHKNKTYLDSDDVRASIGFETNDNFIIDEDILMRWGEGFSSGEYQWLEKTYTQYCNNSDDDKLSTRKLYQLISIKELETRNARRDGRPTEKLEKAWRELFAETNLTPKSKVGLNENDAVKIYGTWIRDVEKYKPCEYFKDKSIYKDFDNIKEYFDRFLLRPMKNLLIGSREFDKEFMIEEENGQGGE